MENDNIVLDIVKQIIHKELDKHGYKVIDIILFGSRARGDAPANSERNIFRKIFVKS